MRLIVHTAYPDAFEGEDEPDLFGAAETKITRPLSAPGSPRERSGLMTPGDFGSLQEGREGLSTEDYIAWKLPYVVIKILFPEVMLMRYLVRRKTQKTPTHSRSR